MGIRVPPADLSALAPAASPTFTGTITADGVDIATDGTTGTSVGTEAADKVGVHGAKVVQRADAAQAAVATTGATNVAPFGYTTSAQANAIVTLVNELRAALVEKGIIKGSA